MGPQAQRVKAPHNLNLPEAKFLSAFLGVSLASVSLFLLPVWRSETCARVDSTDFSNLVPHCLLMPSKQADLQRSIDYQR
jgi:hypothetical protein